MHNGSTLSAWAVIPYLCFQVIPTTFICECGIQFHASFVSFNRGNKDAPVLLGLEDEFNLMKKLWIFILGILSGIVLTFLFSLIINRSRNAGITFFDEPGEIVTVECIGKTTPVKCFKIFQTLGEEAGLAYGDEFCARDLLVLIYSNDGQSIYDNQTIVASEGQCFRQIGIYKYKSKDKQHRTIPVVMLMDDEFAEAYDEPVYQEKQNKDYTFFDEPGEVMADKSYRVERVLKDGSAIARGKGDSRDDGYHFGLEVLLWDENANFYDNQIVKAPDEKNFRQIGIYKSFRKTYPIVTLTDK